MLPKLLLAVMFLFTITACAEHDKILLRDPPIPASETPILLLCEQDLRGIRNLASHPWFMWTFDGLSYSTIEVYAPGNMSSVGTYGNIYYFELLPRDFSYLTRTDRDGRVRRTYSGDVAKQAITWIIKNYRNYQYYDKYEYFPGPNSNTFIQWIIDSMKKDGIILDGADLSSVAFGKDYGK
jgi:hypothetical protein